jgi:hypothetical protein
MRNHNSLPVTESHIYLKGRHFTQVSQAMPINTPKSHSRIAEHRLYESGRKNARVGTVHFYQSLWNVLQQGIFEVVYTNNNSSTIRAVSELSSYESTAKELDGTLVKWNGNMRTVLQKRLLTNYETSGSNLNTNHQRPVHVTHRLRVAQTIYGNDLIRDQYRQHVFSRGSNCDAISACISLTDTKQSTYNYEPH